MSATDDIIILIHTKYADMHKYDHKPLFTDYLNSTNEQKVYAYTHAYVYKHADMHIKYINTIYKQTMKYE